MAGAIPSDRVLGVASVSQGRLVRGLGWQLRTRVLVHLVSRGFHAPREHQMWTRTRNPLPRGSPRMAGSTTGALPGTPLLSPDSEGTRFRYARPLQPGEVPTRAPLDHRVSFLGESSRKHNRRPLSRRIPHDKSLGHESIRRSRKFNDSPVSFREVETPGATRPKKGGSWCEVAIVRLLWSSGLLPARMASY
jgi:hypothetical protein